MKTAKKLKFYWHVIVLGYNDEMKKVTLAIFAGTVALLIGAGCSTLLKPTTSAQSPAVEYYGASTNDPALVSYLKAADAINTAVNVTASEAPIHMLLAGLTTLSAAAVGWYARHKSAAAAVAAPNANMPKA